MQCMNAAKNWFQIHPSSQLHKDLSTSYKSDEQHENMRKDALMLQECGFMMFTQSSQNGLQEKSHNKLLTVSKTGNPFKVAEKSFYTRKC